MLLASIVFAVALATGWLFIGGASGDSGDQTTIAANSSTETTTAGELTGLELIVPSLAPPAQADPAAPGDAAGPADPAAPADPAGGAGAVPSDPVPAEPGPCPDEAIALSVGSELPQYPVGSKPRLGLNISNISPVACVRDLDVASHTYGLFAADGTRLWGSNDCYPEPSVPSPQLLQPGQVVAFSIIWSGKTSEPTCTAARELLGPGSYVLRGYLGNLSSQDASLVIT